MRVIHTHIFLRIILLSISLLYSLHMPASIAIKATPPFLPENTYFPRKATTIVVYIAGRNDLERFIPNNIKQMQEAGTNENLTIFVHLNIVDHKGGMVTQKLLVYKDKLVQVGELEALDSGDPATLVKACTYAFTHYPSDIQVLVLWNHGIGAYEPKYRKILNPSELYRYNPATNMIELNRSIGLIDYLELCNRLDHMRGICFDMITKHYLTNKQTGEALRIVSETCLGGKPIDIISCDACLMACLEFARSLKPYNQKPVAHYLVASQEVVLATGYPYTALLSTTAHAPQAPEQLARHIVQKFAHAYHAITPDFTQSAIDLTRLDPVYETVERVAELLIEALTHELRNSVRLFIGQASSVNYCTHFEEPSYKDMHHLFTNMLATLNHIQLHNQQQTEQIRRDLKQALEDACRAVKNAVIENAVGKNLSKAGGLSICLPDRPLHPSYAYTDFGETSRWFDFLQLYLSKRLTEGTDFTELL